MRRNQQKSTEQGFAQWDWRSYFTPTVLEWGQRDEDAGKLWDFKAAPDGHSAEGSTERGFHVRVFEAPTTYEEWKEYPSWTRLRGGELYQGEDRFDNYYSCDCSQGELGARCRHLANLMFHWEKEHGPFLLQEDPEHYQQRMEKLQAEEARKKAAEELKRKKETLVSVNEYLKKNVPSTTKHLTFPIDQMLRKPDFQVSLYELEQLDLIRGANPAPTLEMKNTLDRFDNQVLTIEGQAAGATVKAKLTREQISALECSCHGTRLHGEAYWYTRKIIPAQLCSHAMAVMLAARDRIVVENPGDETDAHARRLLSLLTSPTLRESAPDPAVEKMETEKRADIVVTPRILREKGYRSNDNALMLAFDVSQAGGRPYVLKNLADFVDAARGNLQFELSKTVDLDFSRQRVTDESEKWMQMICDRVDGTEEINERLKAQERYYSTVSVGSQFPLTHTTLDQVYDLAEGGSILYQYGMRNDTRWVEVRRVHPRAEITLDPVKSGRDLVGIVLTGSMPRMLSGRKYQYVLDDRCFGRVTDEELALLKPFESIAVEGGHFRCVVGKGKYAEFYYRVLPMLMTSEQIHVIDHVGELIQGNLPQEPEFTFYIDLDQSITCRAEVRYGSDLFQVHFSPMVREGVLRDPDQELRVEKEIKQYFPTIDPGKACFRAANDEEHLINILIGGVEALSRLGEVKGSEAFQRIQIRSAPQTRFTVSLESDLLELSVQTKDLSEQELLELLASYEKKKRWHRLRSGDFIDLRNAPSLAELEETAQAMRVSMKDLIHGGVHLPKYRALYVDKLLEAHEEVAAARDREFKALIRSFQTIRDSDFEVSEKLADTLRPYQNYGFRWLSTVAQSGFGGILADEMGLGKTLQMLAFLQTRREGGESRPSLVVCPASLVYNWKEEARRFTPDLPVALLAGPLAQRKEQLAAIPSDHAGTLYITSYDLLKRDITLFDDLRFATVILDEAQYIKNQKAAVSKSVRVLRAEHRFALTGTPIENRLSELWSIFDFLMPGFLYTATEFSARFETPIMKGKDPVPTAQLARMTEPFILRRKKTDVLKDLPEKLEETRSSAMEEEQRRLYDAQVIHMREMLESSGDSGEDKIRILAEITRLRQLCCDPSLLFENYHGGSAKREACLDLIWSAMDGGHRMLVFSQFTSMLALLAEDLKRESIPFYTITGATPKQERINLVNAFNDGDVPVFLISLKAGGTGLNLTGADVVIHYDPWWNLAVQNQATDRAHRIGQTRQVTVIKLIAAETIEEKIVALQEAKRDLAEAIITGENSSLMSLSREELLALLG